MGITTDKIRNLAIIGHGHTGKTTITEALLYSAGAIDQPGSVESGKSVGDYHEDEIERQISIHLSSSHLEWDGCRVNLLDTPGTSDFVGEVTCALRVSESALLTIAADAGVQIETIKLWRRLEKRGEPRILFVNKMDKQRASFDNCYNDIKKNFNATLVPITIPIGEVDSFRGVVNLIENCAYFFDEGKNNKEKKGDIPTEVSETVALYRAELIASAAEGDEELLEKYIAEEELSIEEIRFGLTKGLKEGKIVPVFCGAAEKNSGVISLLNFIENVAPSPAEMVETVLAEGEENGEPKTLPLNRDNDNLVAFVYKTAIDQFSGRLSYVKVARGTLKHDSDYQCGGSKKERVGKIFKVIGKKLIEIPELVCGDIGVLSKVESLRTNSTITAVDAPLKLLPLQVAQPVYSVAIAAKDKKDEDKLNLHLHRTAEEDITFTVHFNGETKQNVISGMGELQITIILDKIKTKQKIEMEITLPIVAYRESITKMAEAEYTHKKQSGGHGQYGRVVLTVAPLPRGEQFSFENKIKGGSISRGYMPGIEKGVIEGMAEGFLAGYPLVDLAAAVIDGKEHPVDSSEMSFKLAGKGALKECLAKADVTLLEPVMGLKVFADGNYVGDILSDLSSRRARVLKQEPIGGGITEIDAEVPQAELLRYSVDLRSITSSTASFEMEFDHYSPITGKVRDAVIAEAKKRRES